jgi:23S rRNA (pseudouridine1915-N3)-methyltransferase
MVVHIIAVGKLKERFWRDAEAEYVKRLQVFAKVYFHELKEEVFDVKSNSQIIKAKEAEKIKSILEKYTDAFVIMLDEKGKNFTSVEFSKKIENIKQIHSTIVLVLGGPLGLEGSIVQLSHLKLSLSSFTFTHQMARVFILEQLYRACMISAGRTYHY